MSNPRGQILLIALTVFATTLLLILSSLNKPTPRLAKYVGELQSSMILQISREYVSYRSVNKYLDLDGLIMDLYDYNRSLGIFIGKLSYKYYNDTYFSSNIGYGNYTLAWNITYPYVFNRVRFTFYWNYSFLNYYYRRIGDTNVKYSNYTLHVFHVYYSPQYFVRLNPCMYAVEKEIVDVRYIGDGLWIIGIPSGSIQEFIDEYMIRFKVKG